MAALHDANGHEAFRHWMACGPDMVNIDDTPDWLAPVISALDRAEPHQLSTNGRAAAAGLENMLRAEAKKSPRLARMWRNIASHAVTEIARRNGPEGCRSAPALADGGTTLRLIARCRERCSCGERTHHCVCAGEEPWPGKDECQKCED